MKIRSTTQKTLHAGNKTDGQTERQTKREMAMSVDGFLQLLQERQTQPKFKKQIFPGFRRRIRRHCAAGRGQITRLPVNRSALGKRESRPQPGSVYRRSSMKRGRHYTHERL